MFVCLANLIKTLEIFKKHIFYSVWKEDSNDVSFDSIFNEYSPQFLDLKNMVILKEFLSYICYEKETIHRMAGLKRF